MKIKREILIGFVIILGLLLLIWGVNYLKGVDFLSNQRYYYAIYSQVNGLVESNPVSINGMTVGYVKSLEFYPDMSGRIIVKIAINSDFKIPKNTVARIYSADLMGSKAIELRLGNSKEYAESGDTLIGELQPSLQEEVNVQLLPLKRKVENLISQFDSVLAVVQAIFNENTRQNLMLSFESIKQTIQNIERTTYNLDTIVTTQRNKLSMIFSNIESITHNIKNNNSKLSNIISNISNITDSLTKSKIISTIQNANNALMQLNEVIEKINRGEGSLGGLINNDSLYNNLANAAHNLDLLIEDMRLNPHRYLHFSVFGKSSKKNKYVIPESRDKSKSK